MSGYEFWDDPIASPFSEPDHDDSWQEFVDDWKDSQHRRLAAIADEQIAELHASIATLERIERPT